MSNVLKKLLKDNKGKNASSPSLGSARRNTKDEPVRGGADEPAIILELEAGMEASTTDSVIMDADTEALVASFKKLVGANKQLISVGKHLATQTTDVTISKQLTIGYPF